MIGHDVTKFYQINNIKIGFPHLLFQMLKWLTKVDKSISNLIMMNIVVAKI